MYSDVLKQTPIDGLHFQANLSFVSNDRKRSKVIASNGPGISDFVTHSSNFQYHHYGIHVGQVDRLTFFGDRRQEITGYFIDCRHGSPTLHQKVRIKFRPDPSVSLFIDRGIAHTFDGLENVLTRDEPLWFMAENNPDYALGNDVVSFDREAADEKIPVVQVNDLPVPNDVYKFILAFQQASLEKPKGYFLRFPTQIDGKKRYALLRDKYYTHEFELKDALYA